MNQVQNNGTTKQGDQIYYLSSLLGRPIILREKKIGKLLDLVIMETMKLPQVTHLVVTRPYGYPSLLIPWEKVVQMSSKEIVVQIEAIDQFQGSPKEGAVLLRDYILDKKVLDIEDREVEMVYDVNLVLRGDVLYVVSVDISRYGLLRRIGLKFLADRLYSIEGRPNDLTISWKYIQPLSSQIGRFKGDVKLNILRETLSKLHPADLADVLEEMDHDQRMMIFSQLNTEQASDTLEAIDPPVQREMVSSLTREKVVALIDEMTPGQAADLLSVLPSAMVKELLDLIRPEKSTKMRAILEKQEEIIQNFATSRYIQVPPTITVNEILKDYQDLAKGKVVIMYLYVVNEDDILEGVVDIKEILQSDPDATLGDIMVKEVISLKPGSTLKEAAELFARYDFRALPVVDDQGMIRGVVPYRDVMGLTHHFVE